MLQSYKTVPIRFSESDHKEVVEAAKKESLTLEKFILLSISEKMGKQQGSVK